MPRFSAKNPVTLLCFTPLVTLTTFFIELGLAIYTIFKYSKTFFGRLIAVLLLELAVFQISEFLICSGDTTYFWVRLGWVSITFLPAVGLHLVSMITGKTKFVPIAYALATLFSTVLALDPAFFSSISCKVTYVDFASDYSTFNILYKLYYLAFLILGIVFLIWELRKNGKNKEVVTWFLLTYASFIIPTGAIFTFSLAPGESFPSVFCGFAIFLAVIAVGKVLPLYHKHYSK